MCRSGIAVSALIWQYVARNFSLWRGLAAEGRTRAQCNPKKISES